MLLGLGLGHLLGRGTTCGRQIWRRHRVRKVPSEKVPSEKVPSCKPTLPLVVVVAEGRPVQASGGTVVGHVCSIQGVLKSE